VTGYLGLHCAHELVGRHNRDRASTKLDWLVALVNDSHQLVAQAYLGATIQQWECPIHGSDWDSLVHSLADQLGYRARERDTFGILVPGFSAAQSRV